MPLELPVLTIADASAWSRWLASSAATSRGVWLTLAKKGTMEPTSLSYAQALDEALCHGWIDGQARGGDTATYSQRFTPRTVKSLWSTRNVENIARLDGEGRLTSLGRAAVDAAKADGRWQAAYSGSATAEPPKEFFDELHRMGNEKAREMWEDGLTKQNRYAIYFRLNALKTPQGRQKRIKAFVEMLGRGETVYPQKRKLASKAATEEEDTSRTAPRGSIVKEEVAESVEEETSKKRRKMRTSTQATPELLSKVCATHKLRNLSSSRTSTPTSRDGGGSVRRSSRLSKSK